MKIIFLAFLFFSAGIHAKSLEGTWKSDKEVSLDYHLKQGNELSQFSVNMFGQTTLEFRNGKLKTVVKSHKTHIRNLPINMKGEKSEVSYKVVASDNNTIVIEIPFHGLKIYHFVANDLIWVYHASNDKDYSSSNVREFYKKVK